MIVRLITILFLLIPTPTFADQLIDFSNTGWFSDFSKLDYEYQTVSTLFTFIDWNQTLQFEENKIGEQNPFLGDRPSKERINTLIPLAIASQWLVAWALPIEVEVFGVEFNPRRTFQFGVIASEGCAISRNFYIGINIKL